MVEHRKPPDIFNFDGPRLATVKKSTANCDIVQYSGEGKPDVTAALQVWQVSEGCSGFCNS